MAGNAFRPRRWPGRSPSTCRPGPDLAAWLASAPAAGLEDHDLGAVAGSWWRIASWAQAQELAAVAQIVSRAAAGDEDIGVGTDGRPAWVRWGAGGVGARGLAGGVWGGGGWSAVAVDLGWGLAAPGEGLAAGV